MLVIVVEALLRVARRALHGPYDGRSRQRPSSASSSSPCRSRSSSPRAAASAFCVGPLKPLRRGTERCGRASRVVVADAAATAALLARDLDRSAACLWRASSAARSHDRDRLFFSKLAVVTFGGAYAVLAYMAQQAVETYHWLSAGEMLDGLGLAETTPGPLILVTQFVGFLAGFRQGGEPQLVFGTARRGGHAVGHLRALLPVDLRRRALCRALEQQALARGALAAVTAAVVGVILNLSLWFALHVFFGSVDRDLAWPAADLSSRPREPQCRSARARRPGRSAVIRLATRNSDDALAQRGRRARLVTPGSAV